MTKKSNEDRAHHRSLCRERLAKHINERTGLSISPEDVRLLTKPKDPYRWSFSSPSSEEHLRHLFTKQLSKHSSGACQELCDHVGDKFEAVLLSHHKQKPFSPSKLGEAVGNIKPGVGFTEEIQCLQNLNQELRLALENAESGRQKALDDYQSVTKKYEALRVQIRQIVKERDEIKLVAANRTLTARRLHRDWLYQKKVLASIRSVIEVENN